MEMRYILKVRVPRSLSQKFHFLLELTIFNVVVAIYVVLLFGQALVSNGYIISGDYSLPLFHDQFLAYFWPVWNQFQNTSVVFSLLYLSYLPTLLAYFLSYAHLISVTIAEKMIFFVMPFIVGANSMYCLTRYFFAPKFNLTWPLAIFASYLASSCFVLSPASLNLLVQEGTAYQTMTLLPLLLVVISRTYRSSSMRYCMLTAIVLAMMVPAATSIPILFVFILTSLAVYWGLNNLLKTTIAMALAVGLDSFWILPVATSNPAGYGFPVSSSGIPLKAMTSVLSGSAWFATPPVNFNTVSMSFWLLIGLAAGIGALCLRTCPMVKKELTVLLVLFIISVALVQGAFRNVPWIFSFFGDYAALIRVTYHFYALEEFSVAALCGIAVCMVLRWMFERRVLVKVLVLCLLITGSFLVNTSSAQAMTGDLQGNLVTSTPPVAYLEANKWLEAQHGRFNVLWLPPNTATASWNKAPITNLYFVAASSFKPSFQWFDRNLLYYIYYRFVLNQTEGIGELLSSFCIKYVVFHDDVDVILGDPNARFVVLQSLMSSKDLSLMFHDEPIYVFMNRRYSCSMVQQTEQVAYMGGRMYALSYLSLMNLLNLSSTAIYNIGSSHYYNIPSTLAVMHKFNNTLIIVNGDIYPYEIASLDKKFLINPADFLNFGNNSKNWTVWNALSFNVNYPFGFGNLNLRNAAQSAVPWTDSTNSVYSIIRNLATSAEYVIPVDGFNLGEYDLIAQVYRGPSSGIVRIDLANLSRTVNLHSTVYEGFTWAEIGRAKLTASSLTLAITSVNGDNAVGLLALIPRSFHSQTYLNLVNLLNTSNRIVYFYDAYGMANTESSNNLVRLDYTRGIAAAIEANSTTQLVIPVSIYRPGNYSFVVFARSNAHDESITLRVNSVTCPVNLSSFSYRVYTMCRLRLNSGVLYIKLILDKGVSVAGFALVGDYSDQISTQSHEDKVIIDHIWYDQGWHLKVGSSFLSSYAEMESLNSYVCTSDCSQPTFVYVPQQFSYLGLATSIAVLIAIIWVLINPKSPRSRLRSMNLRI